MTYKDWLSLKFHQMRKSDLALFKKLKKKPTAQDILTSLKNQDHLKKIKKLRKQKIIQKQRIIKKKQKERQRLYKYRINKSSSDGGGGNSTNFWNHNHPNNDDPEF